jgi:hypothetical protein
MAVITSSNQYKYTGRGPLDTKALVKTFDELIDINTWLSDYSVLVAYNGMVTSVWKDSDSSKNGVYVLHDPLVTSVLQAPDVTNPDNWHKIAEVSDLASFVEKLSLFESKIEAVSDVELFQKIDSVADLPNDFTAEDFNPNITYYTYNPTTEKLVTYIYIKTLPGYKCVSEGSVGINISKVEVNQVGELIIYFSDGTSSNVGSVVGREGTTTAIKIGNTEYIANADGVIDLSGVATIEYVDAKFVTKEELQKADYATKSHVEDCIEDSFDNFTESLKTITLYGGDANPLDD